MESVRCVDCGYLSKRARMQNGGWRSHEGYFEADAVFRGNPSESFDFVPGETNAVNKGEINCYRQAANLPAEISTVRAAKGISAFDPAQEVINRPRQCSRFFQYIAGIDPPGHFVEQKAAALEADRKTFENTLADFQAKLAARESRRNRRLGLYALLVALIIGCVQIWASAISMPPDAIGISFGRRVLAYTQTVASWFNRTF
ncbi:MAG: hypothetical protein ABSF94_12040 [Steroidobacteraceae bacterium]